jgi:riboflavin synthase
MFTGIITDVAQVIDQQVSSNGLVLTLERPVNWKDLKVGDSVATNGVCLTVTGLTHNTYSCELIPETLKVSSFGHGVPERVNLERSLALGDRLDGHIVQGHVDATARVLDVKSGKDYRLTISLDKADRKYIIYKGSVTIDGVALTVANVNDESYEVALVPHTLKVTTLGDLKVDYVVNIEFDVVGKYILNMKEQ